MASESVTEPRNLGPPAAGTAHKNFLLEDLARREHSDNPGGVEQAVSRHEQSFLRQPSTFRCTLSKTA